METGLSLEVIDSYFMSLWNKKQEENKKENIQRDKQIADIPTSMQIWP
jgi:hypothetical protein